MGLQAEPPVQPSLSEQHHFGEMLALIQRLGSYYLVSLLDFILIFKTPMAGKLGGRDMNSRIQALNLPGNHNKEPAQQ